MITYISIAIGAVSAIIGALFSPKRKRPDGTEEFSPWAIVFIILPLIAFGVAAWESRGKDISQKDQGKKMDSLVDTIKGDAETISLLKQNTELQNQLIERLRLQVGRSIKRVDVIEAQMIYKFKLKEAGFSPKLNDKMKQFLSIYGINYTDENKQYKVALSSEMFTRERMIDEDKEIFQHTEEVLRGIRAVAPSMLLVSKKGAMPGGLHTIAKKAVTVQMLGFPKLEEKKLPNDVVIYPMPNPRNLVPVPPVYIAFAREFWLIPDKDSDEPVMNLIWKFRFLNNQNSSLVTVDDYQDAEFEVYVPRFNPNFESSPSLGAYGEPFGELSSVDISVGGLKYSWDKKRDRNREVIVRYVRKDQEAEPIAQLVQLRKEK